MNLADMLDAVIRVYRHNFGVLVRIAAVVLVPLGLLQVASAAATFGGIATETPPTDFPMVSLIGGAGYGLFFVLLVLTAPIMQGAMAKAVAQAHLGETASVGDAYRFALRRWRRLLWTTILYGLATLAAAAIPLIPAVALIGGAVLTGRSSAPEFTIAGLLVGIAGMLIAMVLSIWITFKLIFGPLVVVLEDETSIEALRRSWNLTDGHFIRVAATLFVIGVLTGVLTYMVAIPVQLAAMGLQLASPAAGQALATAGTVVAQVFLQPLQIVASVLIYYDLRMRKEGFDLVMMAEMIGEPELAMRAPTGAARPAATLYGMEAPPAPPTEAPMQPPGGGQPHAGTPYQALAPPTPPPSAPAPPAASPAAKSPPPPNGATYEPRDTDQLP